MPVCRLSIAFVLLSLATIDAGARDGFAIWDSRCEECHGDPAVFAGKYLWDIEGQLQGQHHIDNLEPVHGATTILRTTNSRLFGDMLLSQANSPLRFQKRVQ